MSETVAQHLVRALRTTAQSFAAGDQTPPCAVLWTDPERLWEGVLPALQGLLPELFLHGAYAPPRRTGPALWLRCIEARLVDGAPSVEVTPILYLPGISRDQLRAAEDCPQESARAKAEFPWFWGWDGVTPDFAGVGKEPDGNRWNGCHYGNAVKQAARQSRT